MLGPWKESHDKPRQHIKKQRHYFAKKGPSSQGYGFSSGHLWMWELDCEEGWAPKNWCFWTVVLEKTLESPLDCKEIKLVHPKGNQSWIFMEGLMLKLKLQYFGHLVQRIDSLEKTLIPGKIEGGRRRDWTELNCYFLLFPLWFLHRLISFLIACCFSSVQSLSNVQLCDAMNHRTPGLAVHNQLLEFMQTHAHRVGDAIQPSHPVSSPSPPAPNPSQHQSLFQWVSSS